MCSWIPLSAAFCSLSLASNCKKNAEKIKRYAIIQSAIEVDTHNPKKKLAPKSMKPKLSVKEQEKQDRIQKWARDHCHFDDSRYGYRNRGY